MATSNQNELIDKLGACSNPQEIMSVLADEGVELSDDQLDAISGGVWSCTDNEFAGNCSEYYGKSNQ